MRHLGWLGGRVQFDAACQCSRQLAPRWVQCRGGKRARCPAPPRTRTGASPSWLLKTGPISPPMRSTNCLGTAPGPGPVPTWLRAICGSALWNVYQATARRWRPRQCPCRCPARKAHAPAAGLGGRGGVERHGHVAHAGELQLHWPAGWTSTWRSPQRVGHQRFRQAGLVASARARASAPARTFNSPERDVGLHGLSQPGAQHHGLGG